MLRFGRMKRWHLNALNLDQPGKRIFSDSALQHMIITYTKLTVMLYDHRNDMTIGGSTVNRGTEKANRRSTCE